MSILKFLMSSVRNAIHIWKKSSFSCSNIELMYEGSD